MFSFLNSVELKGILKDVRFYPTLNFGHFWAAAPERALARVCREAGAKVKCNVRLRDMNVVVAAHDDRAIAVLATGLPLFFGAQLAVDITRAVRVGSRWNGASRGSQSRWRCVHQSARGQRNEVFRALEGGEMSPRCVVALE